VVKSEPVSVEPPPPPFKAYDAVKAYEEEIDVVAKDAVATLEADMAKLAVPNSEPVIPAVTMSEPVTSEFPVERKPFFILNSFAISFHCPRLGFIINMIKDRNVLLLS
jgi:hypothetical protein